MKKNILITIGAATLTAASMGAWADNGAFLSPRAAGNQIKHVATTYNGPDLVAVDQGLAPPPRVAGNEIKVVAGAANNASVAAACAKNMPGSPKAIQGCVEHPGAMPACKAVTVAPLK
ncbi:MAG: hypothetical protein KGJ88_02870 [Verrucomicrobiota bacterium]|nr:hypothetical protein [Verrucomicrobiota bacterium]